MWLKISGKILDTLQPLILQYLQSDEIFKIDELELPKMKIDALEKGVVKRFNLINLLTEKC
jgi:hypothetical protein